MKRPYNETPGSSQSNAFCWQGERSIFADDRAFTAQGQDGTSLSQKATARNAGLSDPKAHVQPGGIVIGPRDRERAAKTQRISRARI